MPAAAPFIPLIASVVAGGVSAIDSNVQNKNAIKSEENARSSALAQTEKNQKSAFANLGNFTAQNPGPAGAQQGAPTYSGASIPQVGQPVSAAAGGRMTPQTAAALLQLIQQKGGSAQ